MIPKSLHTVTALVNVARHLMERGSYAHPRNAVEVAAMILGYSAALDPRNGEDVYGLIDKAAAVVASKPVVRLAA